VSQKQCVDLSRTAWFVTACFYSAERSSPAHKSLLNSRAAWFRHGQKRTWRLASECLLNGSVNVWFNWRIRKPSRSPTLSGRSPNHTEGRSYPDFFPASRLRFGWVTSYLSLFSVTNNVTRHICHISGKNVTLSHTKIIFSTCDVFCHILPEIVTFWPRRYKTFWNRKKCDDSAGTETFLSLPVSDLSLIAEASSGKAIWSKTDPARMVTTLFVFGFWFLSTHPLRCGKN